MQKLIDAIDISKDDILFFGDNLQEGGNDYPVKAFELIALMLSDGKIPSIGYRQFSQLLAGSIP